MAQMHHGLTRLGGGGFVVASFVPGHWRWWACKTCLRLGIDQVYFLQQNCASIGGETAVLRKFVYTLYIPTLLSS